jgi:Adenylyl/Guanylyl and SMODS C-terminal sensor domain
MRKSELNAKYRQFVKDHLSPTPPERGMAGKIYGAIRDVLGDNCLQIGSYARFTAGRPLHDLDVLFVAGKFDPSHLSPDSVLKHLQSAIERYFENPTPYTISISSQSHSITISFAKERRESFSVDIVPAFTSGTKNKFGDDIYWVPEIILVGKKDRRSRYEQLNKMKKNELEWWLKSDPRGYVSAASKLNTRNSDFRKAAKLIKKWKHACCVAYEDFGLKSFHLEQILFEIFARVPDIEIADSIFQFFCELPSAIERPQISDRADRTRFIDQYLADLTEPQKQRIVQARDFFLATLEDLADQSDFTELLSGQARKRASRVEEYLFDSGIPVFLEPGEAVKIVANVLPRNGGFRGFILDRLGLINIDRRIRFEARTTSTLHYDLIKWKVKNDDSSPEPRGEITDHQTRNDPESTLYKGAHFVVCYAIRDGVCVAKGHQAVVLRSA